MSDQITINEQEIEALYQRLNKDAEAYGYHLNPDAEFTRELVKGLLVNEKRYGYQNCPCRLASGDAAADLDMVCPCDYRDADLQEFGTCFCGLYVSKKIWETKGSIKSIPDFSKNNTSDILKVRTLSYRKPKIGDKFCYDDKKPKLS